MKQAQNVHQKKYPLELIRRHPIASVFTFWVTLLMLAGLSTAMLMSVDNSAQTKIVKSSLTESSTSEVVPTQHLREEPKEQALPLLSLGAIALSCTLGCFFLSKTLRTPGYQPVPRQTSKVRSASSPQSAEPDTQDSLSTASSNLTRSRSADSSNMPLVTAVTVVPKQQNHPLDWDEPSLADSLDLRQRRPLSHWL